MLNDKCHSVNHISLVELSTLTATATATLEGILATVGGMPQTNSAVQHHQSLRQK